MIDFLTLLVLQLVNLLPFDISAFRPLEGVLPRTSGQNRKTDSFIFDFGLKHLFTYPSCLFCVKKKMNAC